MAKFLKGNELNTEIGRIFEYAEETLVLISPYIKLHHRYEEELKSKLNNDKLKIIVVFGKNENDISKSLTASDLDFFKQFPNIEIRYEKRLHAKFYANESSQIITSMNLYNYSQDENIEVGVRTQGNQLTALASNVFVGEKTVDQDAWDYFTKVVEHSELLFQNLPEYESAMLGLTKKFKGFKTTKDDISSHFNKPSYPKNNYSKALNSKVSLVSDSAEGYCIRTGEKIPFNPERPYSEKAYKSWAVYKNPNYKEQYCHKTGKHSDGKTSMSKPIL